MQNGEWSSNQTEGRNAMSRRTKSGQPEGFDRDYWLSHCEGFRVSRSGRRLGFVDKVLQPYFGASPVLAVRGGFLGRRMHFVPAGEVFAIVPRDLRLWLVSTPPAAAERSLRPRLADDLRPASRVAA
jgi:hypothetical protein